MMLPQSLHNRLYVEGILEHWGGTRYESARTDALAYLQSVDGSRQSA